MLGIKKNGQLICAAPIIKVGQPRLKDISPITANGKYAVATDVILVDSLTTTGNGYFITDIVLGGGKIYNVEFEVDTTNFPYNYAAAVFGTKHLTSGSSSFRLSTNATKINYFGYTNLKVANANSLDKLQTLHIKTDYANSKFYINDVQYSTGNTSATSGDSYPLYVLTENYGSSTSDKFKGVFKYLKIFNDSGELIYWFVPARNSSNDILLYDKVNAVKYTTTGAGFTLGTDISDESYNGFQSPIQVNVSQTKYGATINGLLGDTVDGVLQVPFTNTPLDFTGVTHINADILRYKFYCNPVIISVNFPNLTNISTYAMQYAFYASSSANGNIISLSMPNLTSVATYGLQYTFYNQKLTNIDINLPLLNSVAASSFAYCFNASNGLKSFTTSALISITANSVFGYCFQNCTNNDLEVRFNNLQTISANTVFQYAFANSKVYRYKVAHPFPDLISINGNSNFSNAFIYCTPMRVVFDKLKYIGNTTTTTYGTFSQTFQYANMGNNGTDYDKYGLFLPALKVIGQNSTSSRQNFSACFNSSNNRHTMHLYDLTTIYNTSTTTSYGQFNQCNAKRIYMPKVTNLGTNNKNCFYSSTLTEEIHFGKENQATIEAMTGFSTKFGATNATIYFDMINHITVNGISYYRDGAKCDLDNWYFAWTNPIDLNDTIYTTNFKDPAVDDTVYTKSGDTYTATGTITAVS